VRRKNGKERNRRRRREKEREKVSRKGEEREGSGDLPHRQWQDLFLILLYPVLKFAIVLHLFPPNPPLATSFHSMPRLDWEAKTSIYYL
jgi:hypothetical protein